MLSSWDAVGALMTMTSRLSGGRLDVSWFAEAVVFGDGGVQAPIELIATAISQ